MKHSFLFLSWLTAFWLLAGTSASAQNLALNKTATASSATQSASNAVDGNGNTRWESASSDIQQITIDLGAVQPIDRIRLTWENAYGKNFTLQVSDNNAAWTTVVAVTNNATTLDEYANLNASGRYVRMAGTARATNYGYSIFEFEVFNYSNSLAANMALNKTSTASSTQGGFPTNQAFDNNTTTRWGSNYNDNEWIYIDLGRAANITQVDLFWETAYGKDFRIEVSSNAINWTTVATVTNNTLHANEFNGLAATGRYVRMYGVTRGTGYGFSLYEFQVYGSFTGPLPVELTAFRATAAGSGVALDWATASEKNNQGFEVQRSADGEAFTKLAWVAGAGSSTVPRSYHCRDAAPLSPVSYYRLKQVDTDGKAIYSPVATVRIAAAAATSIAAYPNPTTGQATVTWPATETLATRWLLTNAMGQQLHAETVAAASSLALDLRPYAAGTYYLTVLAGDKVLGRTKVQKGL